MKILHMFYFIPFPEKWILSISLAVCNETAPPLPSTLFRPSFSCMKNVPYQTFNSMKNLKSVFGAISNSAGNEFLSKNSKVLLPNSYNLWSHEVHRDIFFSKAIDPQQLQVSTLWRSADIFCKKSYPNLVWSGVISD